MRRPRNAGLSTVTAVRSSAAVTPVALPDVCVLRTPAGAVTCRPDGWANHVLAGSPTMPVASLPAHDSAGTRQSALAMRTAAECMPSASVAFLRSAGVCRVPAWSVFSRSSPVTVLYVTLDMGMPASVTVTVIVSDDVRLCGSATVRVNDMVVFVATCGAVNEGASVPALFSVMFEPWDHPYVIWSPSGSEAVPFSATVSPSRTVRSAPASAVGGRLGWTFAMVTVIVSDDVRLCGSATVRVNDMVVFAVTCGAVNEGASVPALFSVMFEPWDHPYVIWSPSGSEAVPFSATVSPSRTVRSAPASAVGGRLGWTFAMVTVIVSDDVRLCGSATVRVNDMVVFVATCGAVNEGASVPALFSVMFEPWDHPYVIWSPSGSEAVPFSATVSPSRTVRSAPASAVGGRLGWTFAMVTVIVSDDVRLCGSATVRVNDMVVFVATCGAVNEGASVPALFSVMFEPWDHPYVIWSPSGSEAVPFSATVSPSRTVRSAPASAVGGRLGWTFAMVTVIVSDDVRLCGSATVRVNDMVVFAVTCGAVNEGASVPALFSVMFEPWDHPYVIWSPSGSEAVPFSATVSPSRTVRSAPASAAGGRLGWTFAMVTVIVSDDVRLCGSVTVRVNDMVVFAVTCGAVNEGASVPALFSVMFEPWDHPYVIWSPSGSEAVPDSATVSPSRTARSAPASATGGRLGGMSDMVTVIVSDDVRLCGSATVRVNDMVVFAVTCGAVNEGARVSALFSVMFEPWDHPYVIWSPSGSEAVPDSATVSPSRTARSAPASATGGRLGGMSDMVTVIVSDDVRLCGSVTVRVNDMVVFAVTCGAVNEGASVSALFSVMFEPWDHPYVIWSPSGSEAVPDSATVSPSRTARSAPASATGGRLGGMSDMVTVIVSDDVRLCGSVTVRVNDMVVFAVTCGAVNEGASVSALFSVMFEPWDHPYVIWSPSGSEAVPDSATVSPSRTARSAPASATGGRLDELICRVPRVPDGATDTT